MSASFNMKKFCVLPAESLSVLHVAITTSSHDFPLQHELLGFSNRERSVYTALCVRTEYLYTTGVNRGLHCCNTGHKTWNRRKSTANRIFRSTQCYHYRILPVSESGEFSLMGASPPYVGFFSSAFENTQSNALDYVPLTLSTTFLQLFLTWYISIYFLCYSLFLKQILWVRNHQFSY